VRNSLGQLVALLLAVAWLATACTATANLDLSEQALQPAPTGEPATPEAVAEEPAPVAEEPAPVAEEPEPGPTPEAVAEEAASGANMVRPDDFVVPDGWDDVMAFDGDVIQGSLDNGLRYLIRNNGAPGGQAQLRLVVQAGSLNEAPGTAGLAHFLEHMMFNGTERFPGNEIVPILEGFGSGFGPDINAYTSFAETVYEIELPARSADTLQLGLDVLYQWAEKALIEQAAVDAEGGVVREEHRRATEQVSARIGRTIRDVLFEGTAYEGNAPIGDADVIETMTSADLRAFYEQWYRPELMTVVAVGDFSPTLMEERIVATFGAVTVRPPIDYLEFDLGRGPLVEPVFDVLVDSEIPSTELQIFWRQGQTPILTRHDLRNDLVAQVTGAMINSRLFEEVQTGDNTLLAADAAASELTPFHGLFSVSASTDPADVLTSLDAVLVQVEQARQHGFDQRELDRATAAILAAAEQELAEGESRQDDAYAADLVEFALSGEPVSSAQDKFDTIGEVVASLTVEDARRYLFDVLATDPYVVVVGPASDVDALPTPEALADGYYDALGRGVEPREASSNDQTELLASPEPAAIVNDQTLDGLNARVITYENGARLAFRETSITENLVQLRAVSRGGHFAVDGPEVPLLDGVPAMVAGSGFESVDVVTLDKLLSGSIASLGTSIGRAEESVFGESSTEDLETLFQLAHLQMTEPIITNVRVRRFDDGWRPLSENPASNPPIAADVELWRLRYGDSPWFRYLPTVEDLDGLDARLLLSAYKERFENAGDFVFVVVGDFDPDELIDLGARYLGTLPDNGVREEQVDRDPGIPEENLFATVEAGVGDQGRVRINWESPYPFTHEAEIAARALEIVVNARLRDLIREELGASYAPSAAVSVLSEPKPWIDTIIEVDSDPERLREVSEVVHAELERIRNGELDQRYLTLAITQMVEDFGFFSNTDWLDLISFAVQNPDRPSNEFRDRQSLAEALTIDDITTAAQLAFPPQRSVEVWLVPAN